MTPRAADSPFHSRLAQQPLQLRVFLQPHRVCVPGQEGTQVFVLGASGLLRRDGTAREKWRYRRGQDQEREQEPDRPNCSIFHDFKVSLSLSFVNAAIYPPQPPALKGMGEAVGLLLLCTHVPVPRATDFPCLSPFGSRSPPGLSLPVVLRSLTHGPSRPGIEACPIPGMRARRFG